MMKIIKKLLERRLRAFSIKLAQGDAMEAYTIGEYIKTGKICTPPKSIYDLRDQD
jgi:hypothetical protein